MHSTFLALNGVQVKSKGKSQIRSSACTFRMGQIANNGKYLLQCICVLWS